VLKEICSLIAMFDGYTVENRYIPCWCMFRMVVVMMMTTTLMIRMTDICCVVDMYFEILV